MLRVFIYRVFYFQNDKLARSIRGTKRIRDQIAIHRQKCRSCELSYKKKINGIENVLLKSCMWMVFEISTRSRQVILAVAPYGIFPYFLKYRLSEASGRITDMPGNFQKARNSMFAIVNSIS